MGKENYCMNNCGQVYRYMGLCKDCWEKAGKCTSCFGGHGDGAHHWMDHDSSLKIKAEIIGLI